MSTRTTITAEVKDPNTSETATATFKIPADEDEEEESEEEPEEEEEVEEVPTVTAKPREKIARVDKIFDKNSRKTRYVKTAKPKNAAKKFARYVIVVARLITAHGVWAGHYEIMIRGKLLCETLTEIFKKKSDVSIQENVALTNSQRELFFYGIPALTERLEEAQSQLATLKCTPEEAITKRDLEGLIFEIEAGLDFARDHFSDALYKLSKLDEGYVTFELIWTLFSPSAQIYTTSALGDGHVYRCRHCKLKEAQDGSYFYEIDADGIGSDGVTYGYVAPTRFLIQPYIGAIKICDLPCYPFEFHPDKETEEERILQRAEKVLKLKGQQLQEYDGHALDGEGKKFNSHGRIMIDPINYSKFEPGNMVIPNIKEPVPVDQLTQEHKLLLSPFLYGFSLGDKIWGLFSVTHLKPVQWNEDIISALEIPAKKKSFICSLVRAHSSGNSTFDDIVRDKGKGLIGLLSGPPGVGKTLTAEVVAEVARRPLYILSSGEMGDNSNDVQKHLDKTLELTEAWDAVLLLDEADVFLTKRDNENLARNAITSVFLRKLEYYRGILLLTTNRLSSIDAAFQSRVHFCFQYSDLDRRARRQIWETFINIVEASGKIPVELTDRDKDRLAEKELNGRQIKNIIKISQSYALQRGESITMDVIDTAVGFSEWSLGEGVDSDFEDFDEGYDSNGLVAAKKNGAGKVAAVGSGSGKKKMLMI